MSNINSYFGAVITEATILLAFFTDVEPQLRAAGLVLGVLVGVLTSVKLVFDIVKRIQDQRERRMASKIREEGIQKHIESRYQ